MENSIAETILEQLGGGKFIAMTGSKNFMADGTSLRMNLVKNCSKANRLTITLNDKDLYDLRFFRYTASKWNPKRLTFTEEKVTEVALIEDIYCDQLQDVFTRVTGLYTRL